MSHTPGPWHLCAHLSKHDECSCGYRGGIWGSDGEHMVCEMGSTLTEGQEGLEPPRYPREIEFANAHLISAAPDMLAALKELVSFFEKTGFTTGFLDPARTAIAKAQPPIPLSKAHTGEYTMSEQSKDERSQRDRPAINPGGMECEECSRIFIGEEWHSLCAICFKAALDRSPATGA